MSNGTIDPDSCTGKLIEMQEMMDHQCNELISARSRIHELINRNKELEERALIFQRDLSHTHEQLTKYQRDLKESQAQKEDQEERISTLEKRYLNIQKETTHLTEFNTQLETELANKENQLQHFEEKFQTLQEKYDLLEQNLPSENIDHNLSNKPNGNSSANQGEEQLHQLQNEYDDLKSELTRARQREKVTEEHNTRLAGTVEKLLAESNERLQSQLKERMDIFEEKNQLVQESERLKKQLEEIENERRKLLGEIDRLKSELEHVRSDGQMIPPTRNVNEHTLKTSEADWETIDQAQVINEVRLAFESSDVELTTDDEDSLYHHRHPVTLNNGHQHSSEAQTLALVLQEQLDAINNEIRLIQAEKVDAELRAEQLESRVGGPTGVYSEEEDELIPTMHVQTNGYPSHLTQNYRRNPSPMVHLSTGKTHPFHSAFLNVSHRAKYREFIFARDLIQS